MTRVREFSRSCVFAGLVFALFASRAHAQGYVLTGVGPVNRSMGGAATAAPLDAIGALQWNPATISGLPRSSAEFGIELVNVPSTIRSSMAANTFGPGVPPVALAGSTDGDAGVFPLPSFGLVSRDEGSPWTWGIGVFAIGGFGVNYPASTTNPILLPPPPNGLGVGAVFSRLQILQVAPTIAYRVGDHFSIGGAPTLTVAELTADPGLIASPDDANGDGFPSYPAALHSRYHFGGGFQLGVYQSTAAGWNFGAAVKSPQWFQTLEYHAHDERGRPRDFTFEFQYPLVVTGGISYTGMEKLVLAADVRWLDFANAKGLGPAKYDATGAVTGLGWDSVAGVNLGMQREWSDRLTTRLGFSYSGNPIPDENSSFNLASPSITQSIAYGGLGVRLTDAVDLSAFYGHAFDSTIEGPLVLPGGAVPGTTVATTLAVNTVAIGIALHR